MGGGTSILVRGLWAGVGVGAGAGALEVGSLFLLLVLLLLPWLSRSLLALAKPFVAIGMRGIISEYWQQPLFQKGSTVVIAAVGWFSGVTIWAHHFFLIFLSLCHLPTLLHYSFPFHLINACTLLITRTRILGWCHPLQILFLFCFTPS